MMLVLLVLLVPVLLPRVLHPPGIADLLGCDVEGRVCSVFFCPAFTGLSQLDLPVE
jgi:hypothetical protein